MDFCSQYQITQGHLYSRDQIIISEYTNGEHTKYKLVFMPTLRNKGVEEPDILPGDVTDDNGEVLTVDENCGIVKLAKNVYRARSIIYELAYCNQWDWFFTGTIDGGKHDRSNLNEYRKKFTQMIKNFRREKNLDIKYLLVPELHGDMKSWHVHGFLSGLPVEYLHKFQLGDQMSSYISSKVRRGQDVYNWERYQKSFGWCDLEPIASHDGACKYVTKYISKSLEKSVSDAGKHMFYASLGLNRRSRVHCDTITHELLYYMKNHPRAYKGDYTVCLWLDSLDDIKNYLGDSIDTKRI